MTRSKVSMEEIKLTVSSELAAALDDFARSQGVSRDEAVRLALYSTPALARVLRQAPVSGRDVTGP